MRTRAHILAAFALAAAAVGCGPRPSVERFDSKAEGDDKVVVEAVVHNAGGEGQVEVEVTLSHPEKREVITRETKDIDMQKDETQHVRVEIDMPPEAKDVEPEKAVVGVEAHYPVE
jgi:hypothetical protein